MIQRTHARIEARDLGTASTANWQRLLSDSVTTPGALLERLGLPESVWLEGAKRGHDLFDIRVPEPFIQRMEYGNPNDPLLRQVLPVIEETRTQPGFVTDPLAEASAIQTTGLIRKYQSRALLMITGQCAINCRYCFRRHFPYSDHRMGPDDRADVLQALANSPEINEIIFSGGDPLAASDRLLSRWASTLSTLPQIKRLRIHSRLPVVIPQRVTTELLNWLGNTSMQTILVVHVNHPAEIDTATRAALSRLKAAGVTLLNQSVILKGVNDTIETLTELSETLFEAGVMPYYLHAFDPVAGASHFDVDDQKAKILAAALREKLPGFLVPTLVREVPGETSKTPLL